MINHEKCGWKDSLKAWGGMNRFEIISCHHFIEQDGYAYFSNKPYNGMFRVDLETGGTMFLGTFAKEIQNVANLHWETFQWGRLIYFLPYKGRHVHVYSPEDNTVSAIEVRGAEEDYFPIDEVILDGTDVFFISKENQASIKKLDLNTWTVTERKADKNLNNKMPLSKSRPPFPEPYLLESLHIKRPNSFSWKQMRDGRWCGFLPRGRQILWYTPTTHRIDAMPLKVLNEAELEAYLQLMRQTYLDGNILTENKPLGLYEYLYTMTRQRCGDREHFGEGRYHSTGGDIWSCLKTSVQY